jgi:hypothetical protein
MKHFIYGFALALLLFSFYVFAQSKLTATMERTFARVSVVDNGSPTDTGPQLNVIKIEMSDGASCYALSSRSFAETLNSFDEIQGFSCVR